TSHCSGFGKEVAEMVLATKGARQQGGPPETGSPPQLRRGKLGPRPSRGGCHLAPATSIRRLHRLSNHTGSSRGPPPAPPCPRRGALFSSLRCRHAACATPKKIPFGRMVPRRRSQRHRPRQVPSPSHL